VSLSIDRKPEGTGPASGRRRTRAAVVAVAVVALVATRDDDVAGDLSKAARARVRDASAVVCAEDGR
jgi:hypothetical protein